MGRRHRQYRCVCVCASADCVFAGGWMHIFDALNQIDVNKQNITQYKLLILLFWILSWVTVTDTCARLRAQHALDDRVEPSRRRQIKYRNKRDQFEIYYVFDWIVVFEMTK